LGNVLPDLRQTCLARQYLLTKIAEKGFSVDTYLHEKQMSMLDAFPTDSSKKPRRKTKKQNKDIDEIRSIVARILKKRK